MPQRRSPLPGSWPVSGRPARGGRKGGGRKEEEGRRILGVLCNHPDLGPALDCPPPLPPKFEISIHAHIEKAERMDRCTCTRTRTCACPRALPSSEVPASRHRRRPCPGPCPRPPSPPRNGLSPELKAIRISKAIIRSLRSPVSLLAAADVNFPQPPPFSFPLPLPLPTSWTSLVPRHALFLLYVHTGNKYGRLSIL
jgi:hypothetical protein